MDGPVGGREDVALAETEEMLLVDGSDVDALCFREEEISTELGELSFKRRAAETYRDTPSRTGSRSPLLTTALVASSSASWGSCRTERSALQVRMIPWVSSHPLPRLPSSAEAKAADSPTPNSLCHTSHSGK